MTIAAVRAAVAKRVAETSLREVADEVGMSWSGLKSFTDGGSPHSATRTKLVRWYYARSERAPAPPREDRETAIALLLSYVHDESKPHTVRERRRREVLDRLKEDAD